MTDTETPIKPPEDEDAKNPDPARAPAGDDTGGAPPPPPPPPPGG